MLYLEALLVNIVLLTILSGVICMLYILIRHRQVSVLVNSIGITCLSITGVYVIAILVGYIKYMNVVLW